MISPAVAGVVTIIGIGGHASGMGGHDAGIKENQMDGMDWSRSPESVVTIIGIRKETLIQHLERRYGPPWIKKEGKQDSLMTVKWLIWGGRINPGRVANSRSTRNGSEPKEWRAVEGRFVSLRYFVGAGGVVGYALTITDRDDEKKAQDVQEAILSELIEAMRTHQEKELKF